MTSNIRGRSGRPIRGAAVATLAVLAAACGSDGGSATPTTPSAGASTTVPGSAATSASSVPGIKGGTFTWALPVGPDTDDIINIQPQHRSSDGGASWFSTLFDPLVDVDPITREVVPMLAERWEVNDTATEFTFHLRKDVTFHDGSALTAEDVAFSYDRVCNAPELKPGSTYACSQVSTFTGSEVKDPHTITLKLKAPNPDFLVEVASSPTYFGIVPKAAVLKAGQFEFGENPIGTGPYKFVRWTKGDKIELERNEAYKWGPSYTETAGGPPLIEKLNIKYIADPQTRLNALLSGEVDGADNIPSASVAELQKNKDFVVSMAKYGGLPVYIWLNTASGPTADVNVRRAVSAAINRNDLNQSVYLGLGTPTEAFVTEGLPYADMSKKVPAFDVAAAKNHLAAGGYTIGSDGIATKAGQRLKLVGVVRADGAKIMELAQAQLKAAGIELEVKVTAAAELTALRKAGGPYNLFIDSSGWGKRTPQVLYSAFHSSQVGNGYQPSQFSNKQFDAAIEKAGTVQDPAARKAAYAEAQGILADQVAAVPIIRADLAYATSAEFTGVHPEAAGAYRRFYDVRQVK